MPLTPEQEARAAIDAALAAAGWIVQDPKAANLNAGYGVAVREFPLIGGPADYLLFLDGKAAGVIEAKPKGNPHRRGGPDGTIQPVPSIRHSSAPQPLALPLPKYWRGDSVHERPGRSASKPQVVPIPSARNAHGLARSGPFLPPKPTALHAASARNRFVACPGTSRPQPRKVVGGRPAARLNPDGNRQRQNACRHHRDLPAPSSC